MTSKYIKSVVAFLFIGSWSVSVLAEDQTDLMGKWQVVGASINTESQRTLNYQYNDDRLVGRELTITPQSILSNLPGSNHCQSPSFQQQELTLDSWVKKAVGEAESADAKSYNLGSPGNDSVTVFNINCQNGTFSGEGDADNVLIALSRHKIRLNWSDGTILILIPADTNTLPQPSFSCAKANNDTENAICNDAELAAYDVSVDRAFNFWRKQAVAAGNSVVQHRILKTQRAWLHERNSCGEDKTCLRTQMQQRLESLAHAMDEQ
ncbi:lysozyme inhibitor LprI family protein [Rouxiella sp. Mn2063]|uniref:lysozyme inhibitor LprI family protein n=1 Tax=Rouxiella sp. Mn2063 TaxID=3395262 RepID=UPI003BDFACBC